MRDDECARLPPLPPDRKTTTVTPAGSLLFNLGYARRAGEQSMGGLAYGLKPVIFLAFHRTILRKVYSRSDPSAEGPVGVIEDRFTSEAEHALGLYGELQWVAKEPVSDRLQGVGVLWRRFASTEHLLTLSPSLGAYRRKLGGGSWQPGLEAGVAWGWSSDWPVWTPAVGLRLDARLGLGGEREKALVLSIEGDPAGWLALLVAPFAPILFQNAK